MKIREIFKHSNKLFHNHFITRKFNNLKFNNLGNIDSKYNSKSSLQIKNFSNHL